MTTAVHVYRFVYDLFTHYFFNYLLKAWCSSMFFSFILQLHLQTVAFTQAFSTVAGSLRCRGHRLPAPQGHSCHNNNHKPHVGGVPSLPPLGSLLSYCPAHSDLTITCAICSFPLTQPSQHEYYSCLQSLSCCCLHVFGCLNSKWQLLWLSSHFALSL